MSTHDSQVNAFGNAMDSVSGQADAFPGEAYAKNALKDYNARIAADPDYLVNLYTKQVKPNFQSCVTNVNNEALEAYNKALADMHAAGIVSILPLDTKITSGLREIQQRVSISKPTPNCAMCAAKDTLLIKYALQDLQANDVPVGNLKVQLVPLQSKTYYAGGSKTEQFEAVELSAEEKEKYTFNLDDNGEKLLNWSEEIYHKYAKYRVIVSPVSKEDMKAWKAAYQQVVDGLSQQLDKIWNSDLFPEWERFKALPDAVKRKELAFAYQTGEGDALIETVTDIREWIDNFSKESPTDNKDTLQVLQDEFLIYITCYYAACWIQLLPPTYQAHFQGKKREELMIAVASFTAELAVGTAIFNAAAKIASLTVKLAKTAPSLQNMFDSLSSVIKPTLKNKALSGGTSTVISVNQRSAILTLKRPLRSITQWLEDTKAFISSKMPKTQKGAPDPKGGPTSGDPISMATGEELLSLDDASLAGSFPFVWKRFYRTSAVELDRGLGQGWSHSLNHYLSFSDDEVVWFDDENRLTSFPLPTEFEPAIVNPLAEAAIYKGQSDNQYILSQSNNLGFYHFVRENDIAFLEAITDKYGHRLTLVYDANRRLIALNSATGERRLGFIYAEHAPEHIMVVELQHKTIQKTWEPLLTLVRYSYNAAGQLISVTNAAGETERYDYNELHVIQKRIMAGGAEFSWVWEGIGAESRCLHQKGNFAQLDERYHWGDESVTVTMGDGSQKSYAYDNGMLISMVSPDGGETRYEYNSLGLKVAEIDPLGQVTQFSYTLNNELKTVIYSDGRRRDSQWRNGNLIQLEEGEQIWRYKYNQFGDVTEEVDPQGLITRTVYNEQGQKIECHYPDGISQHWQWGELGELLEERLSDGRLRQYAYDSQLRVAQQVNELGRATSYQYDPLGRIVAIIFPDNSTRTYQYNAYGKLKELCDEAGRITRYECGSPLHLLTQKTLPDGSVLKYRYDNVHLQVSDIENQKGEHYRLGYSPTGLVNQEIGFDNIKTTYAYDLNGKLIEKREFGDQHESEPLVTQYIRDPMGRLVRKVLPDGVEENYRYDGYGRLVEMLEGDSVLAWEYDLVGRLTAEHQNWATLRHRYSPKSGHLDQTQLPDGQIVGYRHIDGLLRGITLDDNPIAAFNYDNSGRERERRQGNGLINRFQYDELGRLSQHYLRQGMGFDDNPQILWQQDYQYQADGELAKVVGTHARDYQYDDVGQLTSVGYPEANKEHHHGHHVEVFKYDASGNRVSDNNSAIGNRLAFFGDRHFEYDRFGNLIAERRGTAHKLLTTYEYDCRHRLIKHTSPNGRVSTYTYDGFNRRTSKTVDGDKTEFIWQGNKLIVESSDNDRQWRSYLYEPDSFRPLALVEGNAVESQKTRTYWYQNDHLGTPHSLTDSLGNLVYSCSYNAYGQVLTEVQHQQEEKGLRVETNLRFQGQYWDEETGLHYNFNRYYDPRLGRYLTQDPLGLVGGDNSYRYCQNPVNWVDVLGLLNTQSTGNESILNNKVEDFAEGAAFGGQLYPPDKMRQLVAYLERRNVSVFGTHGNPSFSGAADGTGQILLPANPTVLQVKHELSHYLDFRNMGYTEYKALGRTGREEAVLLRLKNNRTWNTLNDSEKKFSIDYVERLKNE